MLPPQARNGGEPPPPPARSSSALSKEPPPVPVRSAASHADVASGPEAVVVDLEAGVVGSGPATGARRRPTGAERLRRAGMNLKVVGQSILAKRARADHWKPLHLRMASAAADSGSGSTTPKTPGKVPHTMANHLPKHVRLALLRRAVPHMPHRRDVRLLKSSDPHIAVPKDLGKWLTCRENIAPDPHGIRGQELLYSAPISFRYKDHVISEGPCASACSCPFPFMCLAYVYALWEVYTCKGCPRGVRAFDQPALWEARQYADRAYLHVYSNRIEANFPTARIPWGLLGCGSWNEDKVVVHYFDRGAFGFRQVPCGTRHHCCCVFEPFGEVAGRQRCPCSGPLVDKHCKVHCGQCWCDHWLCTVCCCHYAYPGLQNAAEFAAAADVALQAYFDGRRLNKADFERIFQVELAIRGIRRTRKHGRAYDMDRHSYGKAVAVVAVTVGCITVFLQIAVALAIALYIQYRLRSNVYESYWAVISNPSRWGAFINDSAQQAGDLANVQGS